MNPPTARISNLDYLRKVLSGTLTPMDKSPFNFPFPIMKTLGFKLVEVSEGTASVEMEAKTELHSNPMGTIRGKPGQYRSADQFLPTHLEREAQSGR